MSMSLVEQIATKVATLSPERQREALALIEQLASRTTTVRAHVPRGERKLKGTTADGQSVSGEEIREARREMWGEYAGEGEA